MQEAQWFYANSSQREGPVDLAGLRELQAEGRVGAATLLWCEGMPTWRPLAELDALPQTAAAAAAAVVLDRGIDDPYRAPDTAPGMLAGPAQDSQPLEGDMALYAAVVGRNFALYRRRWRLDQGVPHASGTWHWPAFLFGLPWMMYRRMYRVAMLWIAVLVVSSVTEALLDVPEAFSSISSLVLGVTAGVFANHWYLRHCQRQIAQARALKGNDPVVLQEELVRRGGVSWLGLVLSLAAVLALLVGLSFLPTSY
ncbi:GYF domain-containing protein [Stenotrophomonas maltophilia]